MDKSAQISVLRKEHQAAVNNYDFDRAELIERQIARLRTEISRENESTLEGKANLKFDEQRERILCESEKTDATLMDKLITLQKQFHQRYKDMQAMHTQQLTDLSLEHTLALERELSRPIPEVDSLLSQSKILGRDHNYRQARAMYQEAMAIQKRVNDQRRNKCNAVFLNAERKLKEAQAKEIKQLEDKQETAKEGLNMQYSKHKTIIDNIMKVKEFKASMKPAPERAPSKVSTTRRARSVSRQTSSRLSQSRRI